MPSFLDLPAEIRNSIYEYTLISTKPFTVKLQFAPRYTALLRVNKQVYREASGIFYQENVFRFPQALFDDGHIFAKLQTFICLPAWRLATIRNFKIHVPVYARHTDGQIQMNIVQNTSLFRTFLYNKRGPGLNVEVNFAVAEFRHDHKIGPADYDYTIRSWFWLREQVLAEGGQFRFGLRVWPGHLDDCLMMMEHYFKDQWSLEADIDQTQWPQLNYPRWRYLDLFRDGLKRRGLEEKYEEVFSIFTYTLSPRRKVQVAA